MNEQLLNERSEYSNAIQQQLQKWLNIKSKIDLYEYAILCQGYSHKNLDLI